MPEAACLEVLGVAVGVPADLREADGLGAAFLLVDDATELCEVGVIGGAQFFVLLLGGEAGAMILRDVEVVADGVKGEGNPPVLSPAEAALTLFIGALEVDGAGVVVDVQALQRAGDEAHGFSRIRGAYGVMDLLEHDGVPAGMKPVAVTAVPVVRLVEGLEDGYGVVEEVDDLSEGIDVVVQPGLVGQRVGRRIAQIVAEVAGDGLAADDAVDLEPLAAKPVDDVAVGIGPGAAGVEGLVVGGGPGAEHEV